jgi:NAD-dependent SIR2 family protein deacetylase
MQEPEPEASEGMSVEVLRAAELANSVYWRHRGQFHAMPAAGTAALEAALDEAAVSIAAADALLFVTGAGMGVDMGLQDFRSSNDFWKELGHPEIARYEDSSDSKWFLKDPHLAWGINYSQLSAYREAEVHAGYAAMRALAEMKGGGNHFCWTSNIDGVFQRSGFDTSRVHECHGNIHRLQCTKGRACKDPITGEADAWEPDMAIQLDYDVATHRAAGPLPACRTCGALARPNVWFCTDTAYVSHRASLAVSDDYQKWVESFATPSVKKLVVIECGAGLVIPSCRIEAEDRATDSRGTLVRINPVDCMVPPPPLGRGTGAAWHYDDDCEVGTALHRASSSSGGEVPVPAKSIGVAMGSASGMAAILERVCRLIGGGMPTSATPSA